MNDNIKILLIEDNPDDLQLLKEILSRSGYASFELTSAESCSAGVELLTSGDFALILLDLSLPDSHGLQTLARVHAGAPKVPIIVLTGLDDEKMAIEAVRQGAQDYIVKGYADRRSLVRAVRHTVERKRAEERVSELEKELLKAQKFESVGLLARGLAHDFNNLLTIIIGNLYLAKTLLKSGEKTFEILERAEEASGKARELVTQLLAFARSGNIVGEKVSLGHIITETVGPAGRAGNVAFEVMLQDDLLPVKSVETQMILLVGNLVLNAREAMPEGGTVSIRAENVTLVQDNPLLLNKGEYVKLSVTDTGVGIPEGNLDKLFDPYFSTKEQGIQKGMGLGLTICYSIVKSFNGTIKAESSPGTGTTFHVYLPAFPTQSPD